MLDEVEEFLTGARPMPVGSRILATLLFTDIVGLDAGGAASSGIARGQTCSQSITLRYDVELGRFAGDEIDTAGDGFLALFDGPARALRCGARDP